MKQVNVHAEAIEAPPLGAARCLVPSEGTRRA